MPHVLATYSVDGGPQDYAKVTQYLLRHGYSTTLQSDGGRIALPQNSVGTTVKDPSGREACRLVYDRLARLLRGVPYKVTNLVVVEFDSMIVSDWYQSGWGLKADRDDSHEVTAPAGGAFPWG